MLMRRSNITCIIHMNKFFRFMKIRGIPWTEEEHRMFLVGLQKLGKGDWRGISKSYVHSRTPTQVASHAQKYFIRQTNVARRKRRSSLFDMVTDAVADSLPLEHDSSSSLAGELDNRDESSPSLDLSLVPRCGDPMETIRQEAVEEKSDRVIAESNGRRANAPAGEICPEITVSSCEYLPYIPGFFPAYIPIAYPFWPATSMLAHDDASASAVPGPMIVKPVAAVPKEPVNVDQLVGLSHLSLADAEAAGRRPQEPSPLTLKLIGEPSRRQSAFQVNSQVSKSDMTSAGSSPPIQAS